MSTNSQANYISIRLMKAYLLLLTIEYVASGETLLFKSGWYKSDNKGLRNLLVNVTHIDNKIVPDTKYIRIKSRIPTLYDKSIRNLVEVGTFKMISCDIIDIEPGAFFNLPNLEILALTENRIEKIDSGVFNYLNLTKLYLHKNLIEWIHTDAFDNMPNLFLLKLNNNKLTIVDNNWFKNTPRITELFLRRNQLTSIPSEAFKNMKRSGDIKGIGTTYPKIFLSKNSITTVHPKAFHGLKGLNQLWLDRNNLQELDRMLFAELEYIEVLFLSQNKLRSLPRDFLSSLKSDLMTLDLAGNKNFSCVDYEIAWRVKILSLERIQKLDCQCVELLLDRLIKNGEDTEIKTDCELLEK